MKFDITNSSPFSTLVTSFVMSVVGFFSLVFIDHNKQYTIVCDSLLGDYIQQFQWTHPILAAFITAIVIFLSTTWLGRVVAHCNLYSSSSTIQIFTISVSMWCVTLGVDFLLSATLCCLSTIALGTLLQIVRISRDISLLFNATLAISLLATLYTPALLLVISFPIILVFRGITFRELIIAIAGLAIPLFTVIYIYWLCGVDFLATVQSLVGMFFNICGLLDIEAIPIFRLSIIIIEMLLTLLALLHIGGNLHRTRQRLFITVMIMSVGLATLLLPSATLNSFSIFATPMAVLASYSLVLLRGITTNIIYFLLMIILVIAMFYPLYLPLELLIPHQ